MALGVSISESIFRQDSTILPIVTGSDIANTPYVQIEDIQGKGWLYIPYGASPLTFIPPNRTAKKVDVILKDNVLPAYTLDTGITLVGTTLTSVSGGTGFNGAVYNTVLSDTYCSIQGTATSITFTSGISLQDGSNTIVHYYTDITVAHAIRLGQGGVGAILELGVIPATNGGFKYSVGDTVMIEKIGNIVRYYLIKADNTMHLLRQTRSKLTEAPKAEVLLYFTGSSLVKPLINSNLKASTFFENVGVMGEFGGLYWQRWQDSRSTQSIGDVLEMADKRIEVTYPSSKRRLRSLSLQPKSYSIQDLHKLIDFTDWHDIGTEFIFVDGARKDLEGNLIGFWARLSSAFVDQTRNGCQFDHSQAIVEDFRRDYILRQDDLTPPVVVITSVTEGSAILTGTASDNVLLTSLQIYVNGYKHGADFLPDSLGDWDFTVPSEDLIAGLNSFYILATDYAGNTTQSNIVTLDLTPVVGGDLLFFGETLLFGGETLTFTA